MIAGTAIVTLGIVAPVSRGEAQTAGDKPVLRSHVDQTLIDNGHMPFGEILAAGQFLFAAKFNVLDGFGRPAATGNGVPTLRDPQASPLMNRISGLDANSCAGCHNEPAVGGSGDFVANVFVLGQLADPVLTTIDPEFSNERNTLGMHGAGPIEALAVEMTDELIAIRESAIRKARQTGQNVTYRLITKTVDFGVITARPDGSVDTSGVDGVDTDLIIKPFHQKGVVNSLRVFTNNAYNHHHGLQSVERFGIARTGTNDHDQDGVPDELTAGDITASSLFQAALATPQQVLPDDPKERIQVRRGEQLFSKIGCAETPTSKSRTSTTRPAICALRTYRACSDST